MAWRELVAIDRAPASCVSSNLEPVSTKLHAAPAPRPVLACVTEVQHALSTFADTVVIRDSEQRGRTVRQRSKQVFG